MLSLTFVQQYAYSPMQSHPGQGHILDSLMVHLVAFYDMQDHSSVHSHVCPRYKANNLQGFSSAFKLTHRYKCSQKTYINVLYVNLYKFLPTSCNETLTNIYNYILIKLG